MIKIFFILILLFFIKCIAPGSRFYKPLPWEEQLLIESAKTIMPSDIKKNPDKDTKYIQRK